ncbi:LytTR family DNA-binding domain-containing protein [Flagellimonas sp. HMM57]|uniref:LytR/AlgR family response regulator transcription factor n=1 Tax=unclassified Flagellimonas TaxID=2644544 RepID=UPI0013D46D8B|nr:MULTISPECIES: LytTR family DNA-binding domain-containing protein [unclassified Flagellimonas]UII77108.1 LytTR family DNA-binding domain-containing protein [Flagellimonas sp. HMM57]
MKCIIVDDEASARAIVTALCKTIPKMEVVAELPNALEALKFLKHTQVDLIFLDIHMPKLTGVDFIETVNDPPKIVLTTSDKDFAIEAYGYEFIVDYLVKPITYERFQKCAVKLENAFKKSEQEQLEINAAKSEDEDLFINIDRRLIKLKFRDILLIEAKGDYIEILTQNQRYRVHSTLKKIKEKLPESRFLQIHRSYIINFTQIIDIQDNSVLIEKSVIPISRSNRPELMQRLNLL